MRTVFIDSRSGITGRGQDASQKEAPVYIDYTTSVMRLFPVARKSPTGT
jgi:hypothetical protein